MLTLIDHLSQACNWPSDRQALDAAIENYQESVLNVISAEAVCKDLSEPCKQACDWGLELSSHDFYLQLGRAVEATGTLELPEQDLSGRHSLSVRDTTWLLLKHARFGALAVLQRNFSCEAILFADLHLFLIRREGRLQGQFLMQLLPNLVQHQDAVRNYLDSKPVFGGINFNFPNPFHTICFGHSALYRLALDPMLLRATAWVDPPRAWFDPSVAFPAVVADLQPLPAHPNTYVELAVSEPMFLIKPGHFYSTKEEPLNRQVELALLAAAGAARPRAGEGFRLWLGLTSGKRALVNENDVLVALVELLVQRRQLQEVVIDGWTGSSMPNTTMHEAPTTYSSHSDEYEVMRAVIEARLPGVKVKSLLGCSYEVKLREALRCSFFCTSAYTASILPSRFCSLPGLVHASNRGRPLLRSHIHRRARFVPPDLVVDQPYQKGLDPDATPYAISVEAFRNWVENDVLEGI